jgi:hypothetical protein
MRLPDGATSHVSSVYVSTVGQPAGAAAVAQLWHGSCVTFDGPVRGGRLNCPHAKELPNQHSPWAAV